MSADLQTLTAPVRTLTDAPDPRYCEEQPQAAIADHLNPSVPELSLEELVELAAAKSTVVTSRWSAKTNRGVTSLLTWLVTHPGETWQQRWDASHADDLGRGLIDEVLASGLGTSSREAVISGAVNVLVCGVIRPSYDFMRDINLKTLYVRLRGAVTPEVFARLAATADEIGMRADHKAQGLNTLAKIALRTGRSPERFTLDDLEEYRSFRHGYGYTDGIHAAWDMLHHLGIVTAWQHPGRKGQRTAEEMASFYKVKSPEVRAVFIRYLDERRPAMDYSSWSSLCGVLLGTFWADIEQHLPGKDDLLLSHQEAAQWRERASYKKARPGQAPERRLDPYGILNSVRSFYLDMQEWAHDDPYWAPWAVRCPVRPADVAGQMKAKKLVRAKTHQRIRERMPKLTTLVEATERHRDEQAAWLAAARRTAAGDSFEFAGTLYRRVMAKRLLKSPGARLPNRVLVEDVETDKRIDVEQIEDEAFWAWATMATLKETGVRIEELLEITRLAITSYRVPKTGEIVPMLQIVPSKSNEERLLLVSPELSSTLAEIIARLLRQHGGQVPLTPRYDEHERVLGPPLPHLFQRTYGWKSQCICTATVARQLNMAVARAGITDTAGDPLHFTPHDFRRLFATDAVANGLPIHIAAKILGHSLISTTQTYTAVFPEHVIGAYRDHLAKRRATRPEAEYREVTDAEWNEFQAHFELRRLALGTCGRAYNTSCPHEHACLRCSMLRVDPKEERRLIGMIKNLQDRLEEAEMYGWGGELDVIRPSLDAGRAKLAELRRRSADPKTSLVNLGIPVIRTESS